MKSKGLLLAAFVAFLTASSALAQPFNEGPPTGAILDLAGTPIPGGGNSTYQLYTVDFTAALASTAITFAFREDPAFISFADASVVDTLSPAVNLLLDGDFSGGTAGSNSPPDWTYANVYGAYAGGVVEGTGICASGFATCWYDGAVQAYDAISQTINTTVGDTYEISFYVADNSGCDTNGGAPCNFSDLSTNGDIADTGGNGIDVLAYAQAGLPAAGVPEPSSIWLLLGVVASLASLKLRKKLA